MDAGDFEAQLKREGFIRTWVWQDGPGAHYPDHTHPVETAHVVLEGEMTLTCGGLTTTCRAGERAPDVPAGAVHSAKMGPRGCRYLIGEKVQPA
jgi:mannose-6-phosphate isomerase-like protein (cupin superfamily)